MSDNNGVIIGSIALKMIVPTCGNSWDPNNLNIAIPGGYLSSTSLFFRNAGYTLMDTGMDDRISMSDVLSFSTYAMAERIVTSSESVFSGSFLSVVLASLHAGNMNFITPGDICCLYPSTTPSKFICSFNGSRGQTDAERSSLRSRGFDLFTPSSELDGACGDLCPRFLRQFPGLKRIGLFRWHGSGISTLGCISYSWFTGTEYSKPDCIVRAQADILHTGTHLFWLIKNLCCGVHSPGLTSLGV